VPNILEGLDYPENETKVTNPDVVFRWKKSPGIQSYMLEIYGGETFRPHGTGVE
jgi:hypothetical protein